MEKSIHAQTKEIKNFYKNDFFTEKELRCPETHKLILQNGFIEDLLELRIAFNKPMIINSCCRSQEYNEKLLHDGHKASTNSFHLIDNQMFGTNTCAIDVQVSDSVTRHELLTQAFKLDWSVGIGKNFVHLDKRHKYSKAPKVCFTYY